MSREIREAFIEGGARKGTVTPPPYSSSSQSQFRGKSSRFFKCKITDVIMPIKALHMTDLIATYFKTLNFNYFNIAFCQG